MSLGLDLTSHTTLLQIDMEHDILVSLARLSDAALVAQVKTLIGRERRVTVQVVAHLAELDTRDVHLREGYTSLFVYCRDALGLSEWEAYNRIDVARAARRFPVILEMLAKGSVNLTTVRLLAPHLTPGNHCEVLDSARRRTKTEVEEIVARLAPRPDAPAVVRRVPTRRVEPEAATQAGLLEATPAVPSSAAAPSPARTDQVMAATSRPAGAAVQPLSPDRYRLQVTIGGNTLEKLRLAQDMLGHSIPSGDDAAILDRALAALLANLAKKKFANTSRPQTSYGRRPGARAP